MFDKNAVYKWSIDTTDDPTFRISKITGLRYEGTYDDVMEFVKKEYKPDDVEVNDLFKIITVYRRKK